MSELFEIGQNYFIRTISYHYTGKCVDIVSDGITSFVKLDSCSWIADSGRFHNAMRDGIDKQESSEIEPFVGERYINISSIVDYGIYDHELPLHQK